MLTLAIEKESWVLDHPLNGKMEVSDAGEDETYEECQQSARKWWNDLLSLDHLNRGISLQGACGKTRRVSAEAGRKGKKTYLRLQ
jgi:hypothetical protein